jgi:beta-N-acetylhexosaminidase
MVGGVILFARNYHSRQQLQHLCRQIRLSRETPLLIMVDQEGGRVQRFINEFTRLPCMAQLGVMCNNQPDRAYQLAKQYGKLMADELVSVGVDLSLAPVLDLNTGVSSVIGDRAFHHDPIIVVRLAQCFIQGMREAGMAATGKHFPGHGSVLLDSHLEMPVDERTLPMLAENDLRPFVDLIKSGIAAIMAAHIIFPSIDQLPVGYSRLWLQTILRQQLGFKGVIFSDDLSMVGANVAGFTVEDKIRIAREAGCDFTLLCNHRADVIRVLDQVPSHLTQVTQQKWQALAAHIP